MMIKLFLGLLCGIWVIQASQPQSQNNRSYVTSPVTFTATQPLSLYRFLKALSRGNAPQASSLSSIFNNVFSGLMDTQNGEGRKRGESSVSSSDVSFATSSPSPVPSISPTKPFPTQQLWRLCILGICQLFSKPTEETPRQCFPVECGMNRYSLTSYPKVFSSKPKHSLKKIAGGARARRFSHPWTAMLSKREGNFLFNCGSAIICNRWILTAAHCLDNQTVMSSTPDLDPDLYTIYVGRHVGWKQKFGSQVQIFVGRRDIHSLIQHDGYNPGVSRGVIANDIALIRLHKVIHFNDFAQPVCLPQRPPLVNENVWATGWGDTKGVGPDNNALKEIQLRIHNDSVCDRLVVGFNKSDQPGLLCAGGEMNQDTCGGDSGGPMVGLVRSENQGPRYHLYGLTNLGSESCNTDRYDLQPSLYINVTNFLPWIRRRTNNCCES